MRLRVNRPAVISETIDGEAVVINLDSGHYYSLDGTAGEIWSLVEQGADADRIVEVLCAWYVASREEVTSMVGSFLAELEKDALIVPDGEDGSQPRRLGASNVSGDPNQRQFTPPRISKYTDLEHLIALDPIHDVDAGLGWPRPG